MDCDIAREALSARIDGEREPIPAARVDEHLAGCQSCRDWQAAAIEQTQLLRRLAGRSQVAAVRTPTAAQPPGWRAAFAQSWPRWSLGAIGVTQLALTVMQGLGAGLGLPPAAAADHVLNESTAWSAALGVAMIAAAVRPRLAGGLVWVLATFTALLAIYEFGDLIAGHVGIERPVSHVPVLAGTLLAFMVWRRDRPADGPDPDQTGLSDEIVLPENASRGRRRSHLRPSDGSAA